jgi:microcystin-dependent protein
MKTVAYNSSQLLACAQCGGEAIICVDDSLTVSGAPFLDVTVVSVEEDKDTCGNCYYSYGLSYDEYALVDPATGLVAGDIDGIFCKGCLVTYMENLAATVWEDAALKVIIPPGTIWMHGAAVAPAGWLLCDGSAVSRVTYVDLFTEIGTNFGAGDGFSTFNLPDLKQKFPLGYSSGVNVLGDTGGSFDHTHNVGTHTHTIANHTHTLSAHTHTVPDHVHTLNNHAHLTYAHNHSLNSHTHHSGSIFACIANEPTSINPLGDCFRWLASAGVFLANRHTALYGIPSTVVPAPYEAQADAVATNGYTAAATGNTGASTHTATSAPNPANSGSMTTAPSTGVPSSDITSSSGAGSTAAGGAVLSDAANPPYTVVNFIIKT